MKMIDFNFILFSFSFLFSFELFHIFYFLNSRIRVGVMIGHTIILVTSNGGVTTMITEYKGKK